MGDDQPGTGHSARIFGGAQIIGNLDMAREINAFFRLYDNLLIQVDGNIVYRPDQSNGCCTSKTPTETSQKHRLKHPKNTDFYFLYQKEALSLHRINKKELYEIFGKSSR